MHTATTRRIVQTTVEDLLRLADQGERRGVRILLTSDGQHFATSATNPTLVHRVDERGCDCRGYFYWGRCTHHALLLSQLGALPDIEPVVTDVVIAEAAAPCRECRGSGYVRVATGSRLSDWMMTPCFTCTDHRDAAHAA
ncbi:MAG: hypothetical protein M3Q71_06025 [Chloroflexota bacterium]|nr:hypothetical protein [Chloroflexota bacterium]